LRASVSGAFASGLGGALGFELGDLVVSGYMGGGSSQTIECGLGFRFGPAFTSGTEGLAVGELDAFAGLGIAIKEA